MPVSPPTDRVVAIVELLAADPRGLSVSDIAARLDFSRSTVTAVLAALEQPGWVSRASDRSYTLGPGLLGVARAVDERLTLPGAAAELRRLGARVGCGAALCLVGPEQVVFVAVEPGPGPEGIPAGIAVGTRLPAHPPAGAAAMPWRPPAERAAWLARAPHLEPLLGTVRAHGVAAWRPHAEAGPLLEVLREVVAVLDEHPHRERLRARVFGRLATIGGRPYTAGEMASSDALALSHLAAPVFDGHGTARHELHIGPLRETVPAAERRRYIAELRESAARLSRSAPPPPGSG